MKGRFQELELILRSGSTRFHPNRRASTDHRPGPILPLPPIVREVIELRHVQDHSTREIAQTLTISEAAAKSRLPRAETVLRASIALKGIIGLKRGIIEL